MLDPIPAHIQFVHRNNIFGKVVFNAVISAKFPIDRIFRRKQICDLYIEPFVSFITNKINFSFPYTANGDRITTSEQFHVDNIFKDQVDVSCIATKDRLPDAMIRNIIFFIGGKDLLPLYLLPFYLIEQISVAAVFDIV